jgi:hypothetical protein
MLSKALFYALSLISSADKPRTSGKKDMTKQQQVCIWTEESKKVGVHSVFTFFTPFFFKGRETLKLLPLHIFPPCLLQPLVDTQPEKLTSSDSIHGIMSNHFMSGKKRDDNIHMCFLMTKLQQEKQVPVVSKGNNGGTPRR